MGSPVVHLEIGVKDAEKAKKFYGDLFGWSFEDFGAARMFNTGSKEGIHGHINSLGHEPHNYCLAYIQVDDMEKYMEKAKALGGAVMVPPQEIPMGTFAWLTDPEGNYVGLWKPAQ